MQSGGLAKFICLIMAGAMVMILVGSRVGAGSDEYFSYGQLANQVEVLVNKYPGLVSSTAAGKTVDGRTIWAVTLGKGPRNVIITGALHASEWIATPVLIRTMETYARDYQQGAIVNGEPVSHILDNYSFTFFPMVNPDGVTLVQEGVDAFPDRKDALLAMNPGSSDFSKWKANIRGVDLNRNYNIRWGLPVSGSTAGEPNYAFYGGTEPESEPETKVIADWMRRHDPVLLLDYHSYGNLLYWYYLQTGEALERDRRIVRSMRAYSGFRMEEVTPSTLPSSTLTYWGSAVSKIPSICVELGGRPPNYLRMQDVSGIFNSVKYLPLVAVMNLPDYKPHISLESVDLPEKVEIPLLETGVLTPMPIPANAAIPETTWVSSASEIVSVSARGEITAHALGQATITLTVEGGVIATVQVTVSPNRVTDAVEISREGWNQSDRAVLTNTDNPKGAAALAARLGIPLLLTGDGLHDQTREEIVRLGVEKIYFYDAEGAVSAQAEQELEEMRINVTRVKGYGPASSQSWVGTRNSGGVTVIMGFDFPDTLDIASRAVSSCITVVTVEQLELPVALNIIRELNSDTVNVISGASYMERQMFPRVAQFYGPEFPLAAGDTVQIAIVGGPEGNGILVAAP